MIQFEGEKNSVFCLLLDAVTGVSDFPGSNCWMVLVILLGSDLVLGRKKKRLRFVLVQYFFCYTLQGF
jgi:hypothetical protein